MPSVHWQETWTSGGVQWIETWSVDSVSSARPTYAYGQQ